MAQKKQAQYTGAMDSVFDFIYSESKKTPAKVKPVKVTGLDSNDPYVATAMAALENPLLFVNDTTVGAIKDAANLSIHKFDIDAKGGRGSAGFSLFNIGDVLNNNLKFVDKGFAKMEATRKAGRMTGWGRTLAAATASSMAMEMGLDSGTRRALTLTGRDNRKDVVTNYELSRRGVDLARSLMGNRKFPDISEEEIKDWFDDPNAFGSTVSDSRTKAKEVYTNLQEIKAKYQAEMRKPEDRRNFDNVFDSAGSRDMHLFFESINFDMKASQARLKAGVLDANSRKAKKLMQQAQGYEDMKAVMFALDKSGKYQKDIFNDYIKDKKTKLGNLRKDLSDTTHPPTRERAEEIRREIKSIESQVRSFSLQKTAYDLGALETQISSVKQLWEYSVGGGLLPAIINGDFYDKNKNSAFLFFNQNISLQPRSDDKFSFIIYDKNGKKIGEREFSGLANQYKDQNGTLKGMMSSYSEGMMDIYYTFTPKGIIENLTTGNGSARQAFKERMKIIAEFRESDLGKLFTDKEIIDLESFFTSTDFKGLEGKLGAKKYAEFMEYFGKNKDKFEKFNRLIGRANSFNLVNRLKDRFTETNLYKKTIGVATAAFAGWMQKNLLKMLKDTVAKDKITELFAGKLGMKAVSDALKIAIKSYLSTATAGLGAFASKVVDFAVDLGMRVVEKMAKPVVKFLISGGVFAMVGALGLLFLLISSPFRAMKTLGSYSHVAPHEIVLGETDYIVPIEPEGPEGPGSPGEWAGGPSLPDGVSCLLGSNGETYRCSQGPYGNFSHSRLNAIDIAYGGVFYAPSFCGKGNCVIEYYGDFSCTAIGAGNAITLRAEYQGHVYRFIMYHVTLSSQLSMGSQVSSGQAVGQMLINGTVSGCWTGPHLHLEIDYDGVRVNPYDVLVSDPSSGGFGCSISTCP